MTSKSPVGDISVVTLIRADTTLDHSQKAEKVCGINADAYEPHTGKPHMCWLCGGQARSEHALRPWALANRICIVSVGTRRFRKNWRSHIDASHSRQPLVKGERLVRYEVNAVMALTQPARPCSRRQKLHGTRSRGHGPMRTQGQQGRFERDEVGE